MLILKKEISIYLSISVCCTLFIGGHRTALSEFEMFDNDKMQMINIFSIAISYCLRQCARIMVIFDKCLCDYADCRR